ncbi:MAG TPA: Verru_Chthon cassette protein A, partial [Terrimicrobiaceae bacterium]|nr:Verru_Chthon cassette protein A [Terrimicrobiaceae bacterium]
LTAMFDTIRIANLNETFPGRPTGFRSYTPDSRKVDLPLLVTSPPYPGTASSGGEIGGAGTVFPILTEYGRGAGRIPVVSELVLYLVHRGTGAPLEPTNKVMSAFFIETFTPTLGYMPWMPRDFQATLTSTVTVETLPVFTGSASGSAVTATSVARNRDTSSTSRQPVGGTNGIWDLGFTLQGDRSPNMINTPGNVHFGRSFAQAISAPNPEIAVGAGTVNIDLKMQDSSNAPSIYQRYSLNFPAVTLPRPDPVAPSTAGDGGDWHARNLANSHLVAKPEDVVRSLVPRDGDMRVIAYLQDVPEQFFRPHPNFSTSQHFAHSVRFRKNDGGWVGNPADLSDGTTNGRFVGLPYHRAFLGATRIETTEPDIPPDITDLVGRGWEGDWSNGIGDFPDGAYLHKPDEGMTKSDFTAPNYYDTSTWSPAAGFFSPTQAMPSAMVFGTIPTAVRRTYEAYRSNNFSQGRPWRTLLFCPNPDFEISGSSGSRHYGASDPPDYLLADLFNMPVAEPYAISEPLSTAGRINMNYQILPFTGIKRTTGLYALFSGQRVSAIPNSLSQNANRVTPSQNDNTRIHHEIDVEQTLRQFEDRFAAGSLFRSAAEICSIFYIPAGQTLAGIRAWWADKRMTGDNLRERPYMTSYPLLTTRSNTYTVHIRAQSLVPGTTKATGEYRGSATLERYVDPADERIGSAAAGGVDPDTQSLEPLYRFRVIDTKRFAP